MFSFSSSWHYYRKFLCLFSTDYYTPNSPQLPSQNAQSNPPSRNNPTTLVGAQCTSSVVTAPTPTLPLQQPPTHIHPAMSGKYWAIYMRWSINPQVFKPVMAKQYDFSMSYKREEVFFFAFIEVFFFAFAHSLCGVWYIVSLRE